MRLRKSFANVVQRRRQPNANLVWVGIAAWVPRLLVCYFPYGEPQFSDCRWPSFTGRFNGKQTNLVHGTNLGELVPWHKQPKSNGPTQHGTR